MEEIVLVMESFSSSFLADAFSSCGRQIIYRLVCSYSLHKDSKKRGDLKTLLVRELWSLMINYLIGCLLH